MNKTKEYLSDYKTSLAKIRLNQEKIRNMEELRKDFGTSQKTKCYIDEYQEKLYQEIENLYIKRFEIERFIVNSAINETEKEVLERRYILSQTWEEISEIMLYTAVHLHRIENNAMKKLLL